MDAILNVLSRESGQFRSALSRALEVADSNPLTGVLYMDEVTPGNVLRPDNARKVWAIYMGFREYDDNIAFREQFWIPIAVIRNTIANKVAGGISQCVRLLARSFLFEPCKAAVVGFAVDVGSPKLLRIQDVEILGDEAALESVRCIKGAKQ